MQERATSGLRASSSSTTQDRHEGSSSAWGFCWLDWCCRSQRHGPGQMWHCWAEPFLLSTHRCMARERHHRDSHLHHSRPVRSLRRSNTDLWQPSSVVRGTEAQGISLVLGKRQKRRVRSTQVAWRRHQIILAASCCPFPDGIHDLHLRLQGHMGMLPL
ncbi:hypothetical protein EV356DRAFT_133925 [Viridothelium virens]|uniref:Uncharacterized protein n=1 Tax=Viridothelium virens TaxID=1048519 RepID=A0A6A6HB18_VIRVR|nr:hypothetical protein EV356DRAFT_133925 [Viridothelium virens]